MKTELTVDKPKPLTYRKLLEALSKLTPDQLALDVLWWGVSRGGTILEVEILEEDHINPRGDGCEPVSVYLNDPEYGQEFIDEEGVVVHKGQPILRVD